MAYLSRRSFHILLSSATLALLTPARKLFSRWGSLRRRSRARRDLRSMSARELSDLAIGSSEIDTSIRQGRDFETSAAIADLEWR